MRSTPTGCSGNDEVMSEKSEHIAAAAAGDQNVDKIREILFGAHIREYETRFSKLEQRLVAENDKMSQFLEKRLTGIATATQRELAGLSEQLDEQKKRLVALQDESRNELNSVNHQIGERLNDLDDMLGKESQALRNDISEQYNELVELVKKTRESLGKSLEHESNRLEHDKVAREDLSALLAELASRLQREGDGE